MSESLHLIDVIIGNIDTAGVTDLAVDNSDFAVAAVIELTVGVATQTGERRGLYSIRPESLTVISRQRRHTADIIIQNSDIHTDSRL